MSGAVREGPLLALPEPGLGEGVVLLPRPTGSVMDDVVDAVVHLDGLSAEVRVICPLKGGLVGTEAVNARFHAVVAAGRKEVAG